MPRADASGVKLSNRDTQFVKGMLDRGDRQQDIAAYYGVNIGRISEVANGEGDWPNAQPMPEDKLPPSGPYVTLFALKSVIEALNDAIEAIEMAEAEDQIEDVKAALVLAKDTLQRKIDTLEPA